MIGLLPRRVVPAGNGTTLEGDLLLFYTDGVTDCENEREETFGLDRLRGWASLQTGLSPNEVRQALIDELASFSGKRRHPDDLTFLVVQYRAS